METTGLEEGGKGQQARHLACDPAAVAGRFREQRRAALATRSPRGAEIGFTSGPPLCMSARFDREGSRSTKRSSVPATDAVSPDPPAIPARARSAPSRAGSSLRMGSHADQASPLPCAGTKRSVPPSSAIAKTPPLARRPVDRGPTPSARRARWGAALASVALLRSSSRRRCARGAPSRVRPSPSSRPGSRRRATRSRRPCRADGDGVAARGGSAALDDCRPCPARRCEVVGLHDHHVAGVVTTPATW